MLQRRELQINSVKMSFLALCDVASRELLASTSQEQSPVVEEMHEKSKRTEFVRKCRENYKAKVKSAGNMDLNSNPTRIPNNLVTEYIENTSDELSKRFSFKCIYSPNMCSKVVESYGSDVKAFSEIKDHVFNCHILGDSVADIKKRKRVTSSIDKIKPLDETSQFSSECSAETSKTISEEGLNRGKSVLPEPDEEEEIIRGLLNSHHNKINADDVTQFDTMNILSFGQSEHDYSKIVEEQHTAKLPVYEAGKNRNQRGKNDVVYNKWVLNHLSQHINGISYIMPPVVATAPFPFVYVPQPPEPGLVVELNSNGNPVNLIEPTFFKSFTSRISSKKAVDNKASRKKTKYSQTASECRSVLECVENRVTCKPSVSSVPKDALVPNNSIENSENVEKSIHFIAWRNIHELSLQRRKRKYHNKPSVYMCEICDKHFTAITSLTYHYLGHLKIKPFNCEICCRSFTRRHSLKYHMMIHANANRFQCPTCKRLFRHPSHYKEHLRKHTGEEPYPCEFCANKFKTRNSFKRHLKMQHQKILTSNGIVPIHNDS